MKIGELIKLDLQRHIMYLVVPIIAALILGSMYSHTYVDHIPIGIVDLDNSSLSRNITEQFSIHPGLTVSSYPAAAEEAREEILSGKTKGAVIIPKDFYRDVLRVKSPKVLVLVDGSNLLIGNNLQAYSSAILNTLETGFQMNVLQGKGMNPETVQTTVNSWPMIYVLMPLKALNVKGVGWGVIMPDIGGILLYIAIWLPPGIYIYRKKVNVDKTFAEAVAG